MAYLIVKDKKTKKKYRVTVPDLEIPVSYPETGFGLSTFSNDSGSLAP